MFQFNISEFTFVQISGRQIGAYQYREEIVSMIVYQIDVNVMIRIRTSSLQYTYVCINIAYLQNKQVP